MGELGGGPAPIGQDPVPEKNFSPRFLTVRACRRPCNRSALRAKYFWRAKHGSASIAVPFEKIAEIQFQGQEGSEMNVRIVLRDQKTVPIKMDKRSRFFGKTDFGTYQIEAKDLKTIRLLF